MLELCQEFLHWCLPRICMFCGFNSGNHSMDMCGSCYACLPWFVDRCNRCGSQLKQATEGLICEQCINSPPPYERLCAVFFYEPPLNILINKLKFNHDLCPSKLFAELLYRAITQQWYAKQQLPDLIVPVPLHERRQRQRGYNQAQQICLPLAKRLNVPLLVKGCHRMRNTPPQARLNKDKRLLNLRNAFVVDPLPSFENVVIIDDVVTTGATVHALSLALLAAGAKHVEVWCVCRG